MSYKDQLYVFCWGNNEVRAKLKGRKCRVLRRFAWNSAEVEFVDNGERQVISRNALKKVDSKEEGE